jgi:murein DD-endopeptidase MepM/ murein hydrolase activator NlpD
MIIANPTGGEVRVDAGGDGHYGASRTKTVNGKTARYAHRGTDFSGTPGQPVKAPIGGVIKRKAKPYSIGEYSGCLIVGKKGMCKMFYLEPNPDLIGKPVRQGDVIGVMQDISKKYAGVTPHIHVEFPEFNPEILLDNPPDFRVNID